MVDFKKQLAKEKKPIRTLLIDGDLIAYKIASALEHPINWGDGLWTLHAVETEAIQAADRYILKLKETLKADKLILAISDSGNNWRKALFPPYKANREETRKPIVLRALVEYLKLPTGDHTGWKTLVVPTLEADDVLGILGTTKGQEEKIIVTEDKDLRQIPGKHYNPRNPDEGVVEIDAQEGEHKFWMQALTGDATDNYPGCPGTGPAKAEKLIEKVVKSVQEAGCTDLKTFRQALWAATVEAYGKAGLREQDALIQARVARICTSADWDAKEKKVILWSPTT